MTLTSGTKLGPYEVVAPAGAGGMGEVYRARDTRLNREVAIKVLPAAFARDPERLRRFQQEAQAVAALNHPNILAIHDFGEHEGSLYIVNEFVEGETLHARLRAGALPVRKASELAQQIALGLAAAHEKGIVHRDLKPENILVTRDGRVKILDFGLAKLTPEAATPDSPTLTSQTEPGVVMGTVGYMSPEQVKGQVADHRSDLFSFGAILYEMLAGRRAFRGETSAEMMNAILKEDPQELTETGRSIPPALGRIVRQCLEKNPEERFQSARDVAFALGALSDSGGAAMGAVSIGPRRAWRPWLRFAAEVVLVGIAVSLFLTRPYEKPRSSVRAAILPPPGDGFWANITQPAAISPDGRFLAIIAIRNGHKQLWLRRLDASDAQPVAGSDDASNPFWSPDSRYVAFFVPGKLKKADVSGGSVSDICPAGDIWDGRHVVLTGSNCIRESCCAAEARAGERRCAGGHSRNRTLKRCSWAAMAGFSSRRETFPVFGMEVCHSRESSERSLDRLAGRRKGSAAVRWLPPTLNIQPGICCSAGTEIWSRRSLISPAWS